MKIKLNKNQWTIIGEKAGWIKNAQSTQQEKQEKQEKKDKPKMCPECKGNKLVYYKLKNPRTLDYVEHLLLCDTCNGKGFITKEDHDSYLHSMGIIPCPYNK